MGIPCRSAYTGSVDSARRSWRQSLLAAIAGAIREIPKAELGRSAVDLGALKLPGGKTSGVEMVGLQTGRDAGLIKHDLKFRLLARDRFRSPRMGFASN
jgi:hypothetical protein